MIDIVRAIGAAKKAAAYFTLVHSGTSRPATDIGFQNTHANIGLAEPKDRSYIKLYTSLQET